MIVHRNRNWSGWYLQLILSFASSNSHPQYSGQYSRFHLGYLLRYGAASVSEYVASLNEAQRRHVSAFIDFMSVEYPQLLPKISFSMPMWRLGKKMYEGYVAVSAAKSHFSIHFSDEAFLNRLAEALPACKKGKRCINIKYGDEVSLRAVEASISDFLKIYRFEGSTSL